MNITLHTPCASRRDATASAKTAARVGTVTDIVTIWTAAAMPPRWVHEERRHERRTPDYGVAFNTGFMGSVLFSYLSLRAR